MPKHGKLGLPANGYPRRPRALANEFRPELGIYIQQGPLMRIEFVDSFAGDQSTQDWHGNSTFYVETALKPVFRRELRDRPDVLSE